MIGAPKGSKRPIGFTDEAGIDKTGQMVFFGFRVSATEELVFEMQHENLAATIKKLQSLAHEATQRRLRVNPAIEHTEIKQRLHNPVQSIHFEVDVSGQHAMLVGTTKDGLPVELEIPYLLFEGMHRELPNLIQTMQNRQAAHRQQQ